MPRNKLAIVLSRPSSTAQVQRTRGRIDVRHYRQPWSPLLSPRMRLQSRIQNRRTSRPSAALLDLQGRVKVEGRMMHRAQRVWIFLLLVFVSLIFPPGALRAQSANGTISGIVTDPSNAVIPGAEVTLTRVISGTEVKTTVGSNGFFSFPDLTVGDYQLRCTAKGFTTYVQIGITVQLNQT